MWLSTLVRTAVAGASYALGALRDLYAEDAVVRVWLSVVVGLLVVSGVFLVEYRSSVRPALHVAKVRSTMLKRLTASLLADLRRQGLEARMNLMVPFRPLRWLGLRRFLRIDWADGMDGHPDVGLQVPITQGVVGECFTTKRAVFATRAELARQRFPKRWRHATAHVEEICSYPVYEPAQGHRMQSGRVLGVLTLDAPAATGSAVPRLLDTTTTPPRVPIELDRTMRELARFVGHLV